MPNANTLSPGRIVGGGSPAQGSNVIPPVVPTATSAFVITNQLGNAAFLVPGNATSQPTGAQTFGSGFDGFLFKLRVAWKVTTKASNNITIAIQQNNTASTTVTAANSIATTGAVANNTGSFNGWLEANCMWDSTSQLLVGYFQGYTGGTTPAIVDITTLSHNLTVTAQANLGFELVATFSDTTSGTTMTITEFTAEVV